MSIFGPELRLPVTPNSNMKYFGQLSDVSKSSDVTGVLLCNLGSPQRPVCPSLRSYLGEFLMDPRVIEIPKLLRYLLVKGVIVNFRSHKSAATYRKIWTDEGSPLLLNCLSLGKKVQHKLGDKYQVEVAMRYGLPSIAKKLNKLQQAGIRKLVIIPLYPQYSGSTNGSTFDAVAETLRKTRWVPTLNFVNSYYQRDSYIAAIGDSIKRYWQANGRAQKLLLSFHGLPQKYTQRGDPYQSQCEESAERIANYLELSTDQWMLVFQSRFGAEEWLQPYCEQTLKALPNQGITSVDIVCPGFSADCLETLEEIEEENKEYFLHAGGGQYNYIACLNDADSQVKLLQEIIAEQAPTAIKRF